MILNRYRYFQVVTETDNKKIITVTLNPCFDTVIYTSPLSGDGIYRAVSEHTEAAGKGINVAKALSVLGDSCVCTGTAGAENADRFEAFLNKKGLSGEFVRCDGGIRENLLIKNDSLCIKINRQGHTASKSSLDPLKEIIKNHSQGSAMIVFSGSLPQGMTQDELCGLIEYSARLGLKIICDTVALTASRLKNSGIMLIKPNLAELSQISEREIATVHDAENAARDIVKSGVEKVLVSMGGDGLLLVTDSGTYAAKAPKTNAVSDIGAGDSALAGFIHAWLGEMSDSECAAFAAACGTCAVMQEGTGMTDSSALKDILKETTVEYRDAARQRIDN